MYLKLNQKLVYILFISEVPIITFLKHRRDDLLLL